MRSRFSALSPRWALNLSPQYGHVILVQRIPCFDRCQLTITWMSNKFNVRYQRCPQMSNWTISFDVRWSAWVWSPCWIIIIIRILLIQMKNDPRSYDRNFYNCVKKPEKKFRTSNGAWTRDLAILVRRSTNWAMKPQTLGAGQFWVHMFPWKICKWMVHMKWIICELRIWNQMKNDPRSYDRNFYNCVKKPEKKNSGLQRTVNPVEVLIFFFQASLRNCKNCDHKLRG